MSITLNSSNRSASLARVMSERPKSVRMAVYFMVATVCIFHAYNGWRYLAGAISLTQLYASLLVFSILLFLPWRIWLAGERARIATILLLLNWIGWSIYPAILGILPGGYVERLITYLLAVPVQVACLYFLCSPTTRAWVTRVSQVRAGA